MVGPIISIPLFRTIMINLEKEIHEGGLLSKHSDSSGKKKKNSILKNEFNKILNRKEE